MDLNVHQVERIVRPPDIGVAEYLVTYYVKGAKFMVEMYYDPQDEDEWWLQSVAILPALYLYYNKTRKELGKELNKKKEAFAHRIIMEARKKLPN